MSLDEIMRQFNLMSAQNQKLVRENNELTLNLLCIDRDLKDVIEKLERELTATKKENSVLKEEVGRLKEEKKQAEYGTGLIHYKD
jgi:cell division protein FtsB